MERREAVKYISILLGGALVGGDAFLLGCKSNTGKTTEFTPEQVAYLDEIAETIIPTTSTPGAKAAKVGQFMTVMVNDCYEEGDQKAFREGLQKLNKESEKRYDREFMRLNPTERKDLLIALDKEARTYQDKVRAFDDKENTKEVEARNSGKQYERQRMSPHYFTMMKQLTLLGYFTSEIGHKQALRYNPVPGRFDGCAPYKKGDKAWA
jgi:hypothetical protein